MSQGYRARTRRHFVRWWPRSTPIAAMAICRRRSACSCSTTTGRKSASRAAAAAWPARGRQRQFCGLIDDAAGARSSGGRSAPAPGSAFGSVFSGGFPRLGRTGPPSIASSRRDCRSTARMVSQPVKADTSIVRTGAANGPRNARKISGRAPPNSADPDSTTRRVHGPKG